MENNRKENLLPERILHKSEDDLAKIFFED